MAYVNLTNDGCIGSKPATELMAFRYGNSRSLAEWFLAIVVIFLVLGERPDDAVKAEPLGMTATVGSATCDGQEKIFENRSDYRIQECQV